MNKSAFLADPDVKDFTAYLAKFISGPTCCIHLNFKSSSRVPGGLDEQVCSISDVLSNYRWQASWIHPTCGEQQSYNWPTTLASLNFLSDYLNKAVLSKDNQMTLDACRQVLKWGGDRNWKQGAGLFLEGLANNHKIIDYLTRCKEVLTLADAETNHLGQVKKMNAMLTKVHSLLANDGLPIYDSRVAAAIGTLVEIYRRSNKPSEPVPPSLAFQATDKYRQVSTLFENAPSPGLIVYGTNGMEQAWASAKVRLGWLLEQVVTNSDFLFHESLQNRIHALEAALFMIGYDVKCLAACAGIDSQAMSNKQKKAVLGNVKEVKPPLEKEARTLMKGKHFNYAGDTEQGYWIGYTDNIVIPVGAEIINEALDNFAGKTVLGGFRRDDIKSGSFGAWIAGIPSANLNPQHASRIAAVLVKEEVIRYVIKKNTVELIFP